MDATKCFRFLFPVSLLFVLFFRTLVLAQANEFVQKGYSKKSPDSNSSSKQILLDKNSGAPFKNSLEDPDSGLTIQTIVPEKGRFDMRPSLLFGYRDFAGSDASSTFSSQGYPLNFKLNLLFGLTDYQTLEVGMNYSYFEMNSYENSRLLASGSKITTKVSGLDAVYFGYRGFYDMTYLFIHWSLGYAYGFEPLYIDSRPSSASLTAFAGQDMVIPRLHLVMPLESFVTGIGFEYRWAQDGRGTHHGQDGSESGFNILGGGGQALIAYAELPKFYNLNIEGKYDRVLGSSASVSNSAPTPLFKPMEILSVNTSIRYELTNHFEIIPIVYFNTFLNKNEIRDGYARMNEFGTEVKLRLVL